MSLLMDALKRAETAKQEAARAQFGIAPATPTEPVLSLEPRTGAAPGAAANPLPDLANHIDAVDADLAGTPLSPGAPASSPSLAKETLTLQPAEPSARETVRNAFAAKQQTAANRPSRLPLWLAIGTLSIAGLGIGGYVWYQLNAMNRGTLAANTPYIPPPPVPQPAPPAPAASAQPPVAQPARPDETALFAPRREPPPAHPAVTDADAPNAIRLTRTRPEVDPGLAHGQTSLQRGDIEVARRDFEQVVQRAPNNTDALLALAAIAQRQGRATDAEALRQRALVANPSDPATQAAALSGSAAEADPQNTESRLKSLLSAQPESAALNFALGNLYSRQNRWPEAQQVYFNAVATESDNPDYLFNLAVSLDHLRQPRLAAQHYRMALEAATRRPAAFDRARVEKRLSELLAEPAR
ncbi:tetratricopeptide repeat protein [Dechloromonas sp. XY25]|uniref:Tetratricopeptide repeat protein n=1 Tax=Dechloromonas hankyongensis TaxID=2908002 RepID=A0ABS9K0B6_9RHOO|nr:tetratricopeptide repeat protein [Dechloromonas hankyongensis]MCG2576600.1 tetratricopeptide repeat protein [Dechloromonas hankyongensis]